MPNAVCFLRAKDSDCVSNQLTFKCIFPLWYLRTARETDVLSADFGLWILSFDEGAPATFSVLSPLYVAKCVYDPVATGRSEVTEPGNQVLHWALRQTPICSATPVPGESGLPVLTLAGLSHASLSGCCTLAFSGYTGLS